MVNVVACSVLAAPQASHTVIKRGGRGGKPCRGRLASERKWGE